MAKLTGWQVTLLSLHDPVRAFVDEASGIRVVCLGLDDNCAHQFLEWLAANPQDLIITSDVSLIEPAFPFVPPSTRHVVQIHDSGRRYRDVALRNSAWVDGITCVGRHIELSLRRSLDAVRFQGLLRVVHNGADFPPPPVRLSRTDPLRLLFMGRMDPFKGIFDLVHRSLLADGYFSVEYRLVARGCEHFEIPHATKGLRLRQQGQHLCPDREGLLR